MREIEYRAKSFQTGEWLYGSIIRMPRKSFTGVTYYIKQFADDEDRSTKHIVCAIENTIGQWTGVHDIYQHRIYEGDIVAYSLQPSNTYEVKYSTDHGRYILSTEDETVLDVLWQFVAVVGNKFDGRNKSEQ